MAYFTRLHLLASALICLILFFNCQSSNPNDIPPRGTERASDQEARKKAPTTAKFYFKNDYENGFFITRLFGRIWYFEPDTPDDWIIDEFSSVRSEASEPYGPDDTRYVRKLQNSANYDAEGWFSKTLKADKKIVIIWDYLDAQDHNYKYRFQLYQPAAPGAEVRYKIWNDAWRARL